MSAFASKRSPLARVVDLFGFVALHSKPRRMAPKRPKRASTRSDKDEAKETEEIKQNENSLQDAETPSSDVAEALGILARECERAGDILGAIKCYECAIENAKTRAKCLPVDEALARVRCAHLLLTWTDNAPRAKMHLEATQVLLKPLKRCEELKCHGLSLLGRACKIMGAEYRKQRFNATQRGLSVAIGMRELAPDDATWTMWTFHYYLELADGCLGEEDFQGCESYLNAGLKVVRSIHGERGSRMEVLFAVAQLQRALTQRANGVEPARVLAAAKSADDAMGKMLAENEPAEDTARLRFHYAVIRTMAKLLEGDALSATNDKQKLKALMKEVQHSSDAAYAWLPDPAAFTLCKMLIAEVSRATGKLAEAMVELTEAKDIIDGELSTLGVLPQGGDAPKSEDGETDRLWVTCEDEMQVRVAYDSQPYLILRVLCLESIIAAALTSCKFDVALDVCCQLTDMIETYPRTLAVVASHGDMIVGHALHSLGHFQEASQRFLRASSKAATPSWRDIGTCCAALSILCTEVEDGASRALDLVNPVIRLHEATLAQVGKKDKTIKDPNTSSPSVADQSLALFVAGYALLQQSNRDEAKARLGRALKLAHAYSGNNQLVALSLRLIAGILIENTNTDISQSLDMVQSSFTISKAQEDVPNQLASLVDLIKIHEIQGTQNESEATVLVDYEVRKRRQYEEKYTAVADDADSVARVERLLASTRS